MSRLVSLNAVKADKQHDQNRIMEYDYNIIRSMFKVTAAVLQAFLLLFIKYRFETMA